MGIMFDLDGATHEYVLKLIQVSKYAGILTSIPKSFINYEVCLEAVRSNGLALKDVPEKFLNSMLIEAALQENYRAYNYLDDEDKKRYVTYATKCIIFELMNGPTLNWKY